VILLPVLRLLSRVLPQATTGHALHLRALAASAAGDEAGAEAWFQMAAEVYRRELAVEPLARLRVHQLMTRGRTGDTGAGEAEALLEIVRRVSRLDRLETLQSPFELADARSVLTQWIEHADTLRQSGGGMGQAEARAA
jgi:hypothetical protein